MGPQKESSLFLRARAFLESLGSRRRGRRKRDKSCRPFCMVNCRHADEKLCTPVVVCWQEPPSVVVSSSCSPHSGPGPSLAQKGPRRKKRTQKKNQKRKYAATKKERERDPEGKGRGVPLAEKKTGDVLARSELPYIIYISDYFWPDAIRAFLTKDHPAPTDQKKNFSVVLYLYDVLCTQ